MNCNECNPLLHFVKEGNFEGVKRVLGKMDEVGLSDALNCSSITGSTPLIVAARYGHVEIVEYLLSLNADPSACGTVSFDGEIIPKVPPLWAAAAAGHLRVCQILVERNVDVNQTSSTNSTPLRGACYDGHIDIVKYLIECGADIEIPNRHGHTALMISCYRGKVELVEYLLKIGALVNRRSMKGNTALHDAAEIGHIRIIRMLLDAGARMIADDYGVTPLLSAAMHGQRDTVILLSAYSSREEQRNAWKLMGATMVDRKNDLGLGVACWRTAYCFMPLSPDSDDKPLPEEDSLEPLSEVQNRVYGGHREVRSLRNVEELVGDPDAIRMQALIIRERILGDSHPEIHYYLRLRGAIFCDFGRWDRCFELWTYILQLEQYYMPPLSIPTTSAFVAFADTFKAIVDSMVMHSDRQIPNVLENRVTVEQIIVIMERAVYEAEKYLRLDEEPEIDPYDEYDTRQETENLLHMILYYLHLVNRVHFHNIMSGKWPNRLRGLGGYEEEYEDYIRQSATLRPGASSASIYLSNVSMIGSSGVGTGGSSSDIINVNDVDSLVVPSTNASVLSVSLQSSPSSSLPSTSNLTFRSRSPRRLSSSLVHNQQAHDLSQAPYIVESTRSSKNSSSLCERGYLTSLTVDMELEPKACLPLKPKCPSLRCLVRRIYVIFDLLKISPLHMACTEQERCDIRRKPKQFVVEKLLEAGADPRQIDEYDNTALHALLSSSPFSANIVKLLLDSGVPLLARNIFNETCLDLIVKKAPHLIGDLHIGRYLSLKQIAANAVMRNLSGTSSFEGILPRHLEEYIAIF